MSWTPAMESYFIDLLLDQVHRGNRKGYTFNKQAWNEMLAMFNAKFGSPYDINVLKSHYSSLWMQFNDIKNLLDQNGFSWDETRQMVIASDYVWDAYIKVHPDAQAYRSKPLVNVNSLCLIYAHNSPDGRYSLSSHDVDFDDDVQVVNAGSGIATSTPAPITRECPDTDWTVAMDCYFMKLMLGQLKSGNMICNSFSTKAWTYMLKLFNNKFDAQYDKSFLKHRYDKLGNYYTDVKDTLELKYFSWDENQQRIVADDDVWDNYIKARPHVGFYRDKTLLNYRDLELIYGNSISNGHGSHLQEGRENEYHSSDRNKYVGRDWTSHMDCYLVDLLLNQVLKGNRSRATHDFTYEAWCEMVTLFSAKFGSHYTQDSLKIRYKYLGRQYDDLKVLIEQADFAWDEEQEMVTAEDDICNPSTKVHPDALSYRNKFAPIYHKLCVIYGQEILEDRYSHSACSGDHIGSGRILTMGTDNIQDCAIGYCSRKDWTPSMDHYLIDLMLEEVRRGNKIDYVLNSQAWIDMLILFKEKFGKQFDKDYLKRSCKGLEKQYHDMRSLLGKRGFSWDERQQMIAAYDDVWDAYIEEHPDANSYRNNRKPNYNDLCLIYGKSDIKLACNLANEEDGYNGYSVKFQNPHSRSDWTPPMDRYFMDLLLEEVRNGSMVDNKFDKLAWRDMAEKFNAEFGFHYDRDVLRSRYMILRKRFNDMKILLNQSGFAWDEMWQMITADERLWDAYAKEHPDVKAYRNRTLPNFNDLFLIYGNTNFGGNENYSCCSGDAKDNYLSTGGEKYRQSPANDETMRIAWTVKMDCYLIGLFLEQLNRGNRTGDTFSKKAWSWMTASFNKEFGLHCDRDALENRYFGLMRVYKDVTCLLNQIGIAWDDIEHTSSANGVWEAYFEEYPDAFAYKATVTENYSDLCLLFGNPNQNRKPGCVRIKLKTSNNNFRMETDKIMGDVQSAAREPKISGGRKRRKSLALSSFSDARKVQRTLLDEMQEDLVDKNDDSIESIVAALQTVPDLDDELFLEACVLLEDQRKAGMFVAMDVTTRRRWLLKMLHH